MKVLGVIPARGGSKGIPNKNIKPLVGKSLVERTYETARKCPSLDRIILSTDDEKIAELGKSLGIEVPFIRPKELATDTTPMFDVIYHVLVELQHKDNYYPDVVLILQPTTPLRKSEYIETAVKLLKDNDSVCSLIQVPDDMSPYYLMKITDAGLVDYFMEEGKKIKRRQDAPKAYKRDGSIYLTKTSVIFEKKSLYGDKCVPLFVDSKNSINIDTEEDWHKAEELIEKNLYR
jgi:CMP-N,N'-diacetyllegionaminic acid synthase